MSQAVVIKCPGCQRELRVPPEMIEKKIRCKFCSTTFEARKKTRAPIPKPIRPQAAAAIDDLPELEPIDDPPMAPNFTPRAETLPHYHGGTVQSPPPLPPRVDAPPAATGANYTDGDYAPAFGTASRYTGRGRYRGPSRGNTLTWIVVSLASLVMAALVVVVLVKPDLFGKKEGSREVVESSENTGNPEGEGAPNVDTPQTPVKAPTWGGSFPRRMLSINISNYLFLNPLYYGDSRNFKDRRDTHGAMMKLANAWKIPSDQLYELSDGPTAEEGMDRTPMERFPMKSNVMKTIELFCESCRPQDRIVFLFSGHASEKDGKAYIAPIEGEFEEVETLIPLEDIYAKFAACKAQEKLIIWDVCRFNPDRGVERPSFGKMTEALEKALHSPPDGVLVWTSCSKDEYAFEFDDTIAGPKNSRVNGSVFLSHFRLASAAGVMNKTGRKGAGGISEPQDPLPYKPLMEWINEEVSSFVPMVTRGEKQTPKFSGTEGPSVEYDAGQPLAAKFEIPKIAQGADPKLVEGIFSELRLPPLKALRQDGSEAAQFDVAFPFSAEAMKKYKPDGVTRAEIEAEPQKYKFRATVIEAFEGMRDLQKKGADFPEEFRSPISDAKKREVLGLQREPARRQATLRNLKAALESVADLKEKETPRWQANYDYALAQVKLRYAYLSEYDLALGKVRQELLPTLEGNQKGWKLASAEKMKAPKDIRDMADVARAAMGDLIANHPNTPWALVAKREKGFALGLEWQASSFGSE